MKLTPAQRKLLEEFRNTQEHHAGERGVSHWHNRRTVRALECKGFLQDFGDFVVLTEDRQKAGLKEKS